MRRIEASSDAGGSAGLHVAPSALMRFGLFVVCGIAACSTRQVTLSPGAGAAGHSSAGGAAGNSAGAAGAAGHSSAGGAAGQSSGGAAGEVGQAGSSGLGGGCPPAPDTNPPGCHPADSNVYHMLDPVLGACTPGLVCAFVTIPNAIACTQAVYIEPYICCDAGSGTVFVPGTTPDSCPRPAPNQDPGCSIPLPAPCPTEGLSCHFSGVSGADGGCGDGFLGCGTSYQYALSCCHGSWTQYACPADAGSD